MTPACAVWAYSMGVISWSYDLAKPENQRKLDIVDELATVAEDAGVSMIELALAFVIQHPAVTAAIIGPRTMEHLENQLSATDVVLDDEVLDRIDRVVPPGTNLNSADAGWEPPAVVSAWRRRRGARQLQP